MPFPKLKNGELVDGKVFKTLNTCKRYYYDDNKKCKKFYASLKNNNDDVKIVKCPYGITCAVKNNNIINSMIIKENIDKKTTGNLNKYDGGITNLPYMRIKEFKLLINYEEDRQFENDLKDDILHDMRNLIRDLKTEIDIVESEQEALDDTFKTLNAFIDLVRYRFKFLDDLDAIEINEEKGTIQYIHPILHKFRKMFETSMRKKDLRMYLEKNVQYNDFYLTDGIYFAIFIIIENTIKHSNPNTEISITFNEPTKTETHVYIKNYTTSIDESEVKKLVERGYRAKYTRTKGTGIGLSIAFNLFQKNNIEFKYFITEEGDDTLFNVELVFKK